MDLTTWFAFASASIALLLIPGPTVLLVLAYALGQGRRVAVPTALGVAAGDLIAMTASLAGLGALVLTSATLFTVLKCTSSVSSWITLREMEEKMVEEAEAAGDLFLRAGIIESCRFVWNLAAQHYSEKFSYGKLANVYGCLARAFVSRVPPIDAAQQQEVSISMGRFASVRCWSSPNRAPLTRT